MTYRCNELSITHKDINTKMEFYKINVKNYIMFNLLIDPMFIIYYNFSYIFLIDLPDVLLQPGHQIVQVEHAVLNKYFQCVCTRCCDIKCENTLLNLFIFSNLLCTSSCIAI